MKVPEGLLLKILSRGLKLPLFGQFFRKKELIGLQQQVLFWVPMKYESLECL